MNSWLNFYIRKDVLERFMEVYFKAKTSLFDRQVIRVLSMLEEKY